MIIPNLFVECSSEDVASAIVAGYSPAFINVSFVLDVCNIDTKG